MDRTALIEELRKTQERCQVGIPPRQNAYEDLHDLLAECYGRLGQAIAELERHEPATTEELLNAVAGD